MAISQWQIQRIPRLPQWATVILWNAAPRRRGGIGRAGDEYQQSAICIKPSWLILGMDRKYIGHYHGWFFSEKNHETLLYLPHALRSMSLGLQSLHLECCNVRAQRRKASSGLKERIMWQGPQFHSKDSSQIPQAFCCLYLRCTLITKNVGRMEKDGTMFVTCFGWDTWCVNWIPQYVVYRIRVS